MSFAIRHYSLLGRVGVVRATVHWPFTIFYVCVVEQRTGQYQRHPRTAGALPEYPHEIPVHDLVMATQPLRCNWSTSYQTHAVV